MSANGFIERVRGQNGRIRVYRVRGLDPNARPLDPELAPVDVPATLVEIPIMVLVEDGAEFEGAYLGIVTDLGVSHVAHLAGGSHPASVFSRSDQDW